MVIYFTAFTFLLVCTFVFDHDHDFHKETFNANKTLFLLLAFVMLTLIIGIRYQIGADWFSYQYYYDLMAQFSFTGILQLKDPGYQIINYTAHQLDWGMMGVNLVCGAIFVYALIAFSTQQSDVFLSLLVALPYLFIVVGMGYARQAVAIAFFLLAINQLYRENIVGYVALLLIGGFFHKTAVVMIPIAFLITERSMAQKLFFGAIFSVSVIFFFFAKSMDSLMYAYVGRDHYNSQGALIRVVMSLLPALLFLLFSDRFKFTPIIGKLVFLLSCAAVIFFILLFVLSSLSTVIDRFALYIIPLQMLVLANANGLVTRWNKFMVHTLVCAYCFAVMFVWLNFASHANAWVPYKYYNIFGLTL